MKTILYQQVAKTTHEKLISIICREIKPLEGHIKTMNRRFNYEAYDMLRTNVFFANTDHPLEYWGLYIQVVKIIPCVNLADKYFPINHAFSTSVIAQLGIDRLCELTNLEFTDKVRQGVKEMIASSQPQT